MVGYGGSVTVGSPRVLSAVGGDAAVVRAAGADDVSVVFGSAVSAAASTVAPVSGSTAAIFSSDTVRTAAVDDFCLSSGAAVASGVGVVVSNWVSSCSTGFGFSEVGSL